MMCKKIILFSLLLWLIQSANAQVYKCQTEGKTVYSQTPCDADVKEMHLKTQSAASSGFGLREGEIRMLEQINARENEEKRNDDPKEDRKQRLREIQAEAMADARGRECAEKASLLIELQKIRNESHSISKIRDTGGQIEKIKEAMDKIGCDQ